MNPIIKFTTLFGLLAVELAIEMQSSTRLTPGGASSSCSALVFVYRSFYGMRIGATAENKTEAGSHGAKATASAT